MNRRFGFVFNKRLDVFPIIRLASFLGKNSARARAKQIVVNGFNHAITFPIFSSFSNTLLKITSSIELAKTKYWQKTDHSDPIRFARSSACSLAAGVQEYSQN